MVNHLSSYQNAIVEAAAFELAKVPAGDRLFLIKVLEDQEAFNYELKSGLFLLDPEKDREAGYESTMQLCNFPAKPSMCIVGALVAAKLPVTATAGQVVRLSETYTEKHKIEVDPLDKAIQLEVIPQLIEELRRLDAEDE
jgi:hypothetical protein